MTADPSSRRKPLANPPAANLRLDHRGRWLQDGEEITHPRILRALHRGIRREASGEYSVQIGWQKAIVQVDECPYFVRSLEFVVGELPALTLSDGSEERLDPSTLNLAREDALFCRVKGNAHTARFLPAAMMQFGDRTEERGDDLVFISGRGEYPIRQGISNDDEEPGEGTDDD
ncbi:MAG: hypothetical protein O7H41_17745 [Planctomycetota bacterium]|nr:hypothetical protein [Planctomycetota bacterium]